MDIFTLTARQESKKNSSLHKPYGKHDDTIRGAWYIQGLEKWQQKNRRTNNACDCLKEQKDFFLQTRHTHTATSHSNTKELSGRGSSKRAKKEGEKNFFFCVGGNAAHTCFPPHKRVFLPYLALFSHFLDENWVSWGGNERVFPPHKTSKPSHFFSGRLRPFANRKLIPKGTTVQVGKPRTYFYRAIFLNILKDMFVPLCAK